MSTRKSVISAVILSCAALLAVSVSALAQGNMRIARPVDSATVREVVNILVPVSAVPEGGFITCIVDNHYRCATDNRSEDGRYYVYRWDTKAVEVSPETGEIKGRPQDGKHDIVAQAYGTDGKKTGLPAKVTVYLKNDASADMPSNGIKLRYKSVPGATNRYHFKYTEDIDSVEGATTLAKAVGESVEGGEGTVSRSVDDRVSADSVLVRQNLIGDLTMFYAGKPVPQSGLMTKSEYHIEDSTGHVTYLMSSRSHGIPVGIDLPILPAKAVKIGDSWVEPLKVFKYALTGEAAKLSGTSTLEALEWQDGQPCARIKTQFSGTIRLPYSTITKTPLSVNGAVTTYFAYKIGKLISFSAWATAEPELPSQVLSSWFQQILAIKNPGGASDSSAAGTPSGPIMSSTGAAVKVKLAFRHTLELVR
jgi:hypothetical protein